jgi:hypothetical protein
VVWAVLNFFYPGNAKYRFTNLLNHINAMQRIKPPINSPTLLVFFFLCNFILLKKKNRQPENIIERVLPAHTQFLKKSSNRANTDLDSFSPDEQMYLSLCHRINFTDTHHKRSSSFKTTLKIFIFYFFLKKNEKRRRASAIVTHPFGLFRARYTFGGCLLGRRFPLT